MKKDKSNISDIKDAASLGKDAADFVKNNNLPVRKIVLAGVIGAGAFAALKYANRSKAA